MWIILFILAFEFETLKPKLMKHLSLHSFFLLALLAFGMGCGSDDAPVYTFPSRPAEEEPDKPGPGPDEPGPGPDEPVDPDGDYPKGMTVDFKELELDGKTTKVWTVMVDFEANPNLRFNPLFLKPAKTPTSVFTHAQTLGIGTPYITTNAGYFSYDSSVGYVSVSLCVNEGKIESSPANGLIYPTVDGEQIVGIPVRAAFGQMADGTFEATWCQIAAEDRDHVYSFPSPLDNDEQKGIYMTSYPSNTIEGARLWEPRNAIGGGPMLVYDGENVAMDYYWRECLDAGGTQGTRLVQRTAIGGTKDGKKMMLVVTGGRGVDGSAGLNLTQLADLFVEAGMDYAVNLDGGGSSTMVGFDGSLLTTCAGDKNSSGNYIQRTVPTAIVLTQIGE